MRTKISIYLQRGKCFDCRILTYEKQVKIRVNIIVKINIFTRTLNY